MPIPEVKSQDDVGLCIRALRREGRPLDQCQAICMGKLEEYQKKNK